MKMFKVRLESNRYFDCGDTRISLGNAEYYLNESQIHTLEKDPGCVIRNKEVMDDGALNVFNLPIGMRPKLINKRITRT